MKLILASQSPRRKQLLEMMGLQFDTIPSQFEEYFDHSRTADEIAKELGLGKVREVAEKYPDAIVIGGDVIVVLDGKQLGKPESEQEAYDMIRGFSSRTHEIITSVAVVCRSKQYEKVLTETSHITFGDLPDDVIWEYIRTGNPYDKAGGYAIQHPLIKPYVLKIEGRMDTIVGMPTNLVAHFLADFDYELEPVELSGDELIV